jgi:hypothetical protein
MTHSGYLSKDAEAMASAIASATDLQQRLSTIYSAPQLAQMTQLNPTDLNDAAEELRSAGLVKLMKTGLSQEGYNFFSLDPLHTLYYGFARLVPGELDPRSDPGTAAVAIAALEEANEPQLMKELGWPLGRVTIAVAALEAADAVTAIPGEGGKPPVGFYKVLATAATRRIARLV